MVVVIDYGLGNVGSLLNMFKKLGVEAKLSALANDLHKASHLVLPGVGTYDIGMKNLEQYNLLGLLNRTVIENNIPILGICLGAQLMMDSSTEGKSPGLGWIKGSCIKFSNSSGIKIPHMGWNKLHKIYDNTLFNNLPHNPPRFYFVHTYHFNLTINADISATTIYGKEFASAFRKGNIFGVQFHPEKSHKFGMQVLLNFSRT